MADDSKGSVREAPLGSRVRAWAAHKLRPDDAVVVGLIAISAAACLATGSGYTLLSPLTQYGHFFAFYFMLFFVVTRLTNEVVARVEPRSRVGRAVARLLGAGADDAAVRSLDYEVARSSLLFLAALATYSNVKVRIPVFNSFVGDPIFEQMDRALFRTDFAWLVDWVRESPLRDEIFQRIYVHDYIFMALLVLLLYLRRDARMIRTLFVAAALAYLLGVWITVACPSYGPCFVDRESWLWLNDHPMGRYQYRLYAGFEAVMRAHASGGEVPTRTFSGIAAFPSLHVGHMLLMACVAFATRGLRWYGGVMVVAALMTTVATLAYGWHYAVDAIGALLLAWLSFRIAERLTRPKAAGPPPPSPAQPSP